MHARLRIKKSCPTKIILRLISTLSHSNCYIHELHNLAGLENQCSNILENLATARQKLTMPPKGSTRGRGSGTRGRGRGRGRGKSLDDLAAAPAEPIGPSVVSQTLKVEDDESQSTLSDSPRHNVPQTAPDGVEAMELVEAVEAVAAVQAQSETQRMDVDNADDPMDPNTSPASQPTETPAPTPLRPAPAPSIVPAVLGEKVKKESRFKPKANRSAKSKLDELADQERRRKAQSAADEARAAGRAARGMDFRGMRGRGRGDAMGRGRIPQSSGAGLWGVAPEMRKFEYLSLTC